MYLRQNTIIFRKQVFVLVSITQCITKEFLLNTGVAGFVCGGFLLVCFLGWFCLVGFFFSIACYRLIFREILYLPAPRF